MKQLGVKVLTKIENLISEIDKPQPSKNTPRRHNNNPNHTMSFGEVEEDQKGDIYRRLSYTYLGKQDKINKQNKDRIYEEQKDFQKYKVTNKKTIKILSKKQIKPIHQRIDEIMQKKDRYVQQLRKYYEDREQETMLPERLSIDTPSTKKFSHHQLQDYRNEIDYRNRERLRKKHLNELSFMKKDEYSGIPAVNHASRSLSSRRFLKKQYSENVFKRMSQYVHEKREKKVEMLERRTEEQGGFQPVIDHHSRQLAKRTKDQRSLSNKVLNNSHCKHCDTAKQHEQLKNSQMKPAKEIKLITRDKSPISAKENKTTPSKIKNKEISQSKISKTKTVGNSKVSVTKTPIKTNKSRDLSPIEIPTNSKSPLKESSKNSTNVKKTVKR